MMRFKVAGMTCGHCAATVRGAIEKAVRGANVEVDRATGTVAVGGAAAMRPDQVKAAIERAGYTVERQMA